MPKLSATLAWFALFKSLGASALLLLTPSWGWSQESASRTSGPSVDESFSAFHQALSAKASDLLASTQYQSAVENPSSESPISAALNKQDQEGQVAHSLQSRQAVERVQKLTSVFEPILREEGVPHQLAAIVLVESGGLPTAFSAKGARGLWQLMPETARRYGLVVTTDRDERLDLYKSTRGAALYLRDLYTEFKDWSLVLAAYNAGEQTVQRAIDRSGATDFSQLNRLLPAETRSYVPAVWASLARLGYKGPAGQLVSVSDSQTGARVFYANSGRSYGGGQQLGQF